MKKEARIYIKQNLQVLHVDEPIDDVKWHLVHAIVSLQVVKVSSDMMRCIIVNNPGSFRWLHALNMVGLCVKMIVRFWSTNTCNITRFVSQLAMNTIIRIGGERRVTLIGCRKTIVGLPLLIAASSIVGATMVLRVGITRLGGSSSCSSNLVGSRLKVFIAFCEFFISNSGVTSRIEAEIPRNSGPKPLRILTISSELVTSAPAVEFIRNRLNILKIFNACWESLVSYASLSGKLKILVWDLFTAIVWSRDAISVFWISWSWRNQRENTGFALVIVPVVIVREWQGADPSRWSYRSWPCISIKNCVFHVEKFWLPSNLIVNRNAGLNFDDCHSYVSICSDN